MLTFEQIQDRLGSLPEFPRFYLFGTTGAGKTSIVRQILGTLSLSFPTALQSRTTVAPTEYVLSRNLDFKATFIFKNKSDIERSIDEILEATISKIIEKKDEEELVEEVVDALGSTPDERFRLRYILDDKYLEELAGELIEFVSISINKNIESEEEESFVMQIAEQLSLYNQKIMRKIEKTTNTLDPKFKLFRDEMYTCTEDNKGAFVEKIKKLLKSEKDSISPLIEYARVEGPLLANWIPQDVEIVLIDGEGIGHNMKEGSSLSTRHIEYFNFVDSILLVERADNPFLSGGLSAIKKITLDGYINKLSLIFSKVDLIDTTDIVRTLGRRISNVANALKVDKIDFKLTKAKKFYLSKIDKKLDVSMQDELVRLLSSKNIAGDTKKLKYDFDTLFSQLDTDRIHDKWAGKLAGEHWGVIKAFNRRLANGENEYRYLKPVAETHTFIMKEIHSFLKKDNSLEAITYNSINKIKMSFSSYLLAYLDKKLLEDARDDLLQSFTLSGSGSAKVRRDALYEIFVNYFPNKNEKQKFKIFLEDTKNQLLKSGADKRAPLQKVSIENITIKNLFGKFNFTYDLNDNINILIGKNGTGKSTILKLLYSTLKQDDSLLTRIGKPIVEIDILKKYEDEEPKIATINLHEKKQNIDVEYIDTFDSMNTNLDSRLSDLSNNFLLYTNELKSRYENEDKILKQQLDTLINADEIDAGALKSTNAKQKELKKVFNSLEIFKNIMNTALSSSHKTMEVNTKGEIVIYSDDDMLEVYDLSSGEKQLFIIFLSVLLKENKPYILLLDEPEISLHVQWQTSLITNILELNSSVQVILVTHNPLTVLGRSSSEIAVLHHEKDSIKIEYKNKNVEQFDVSTLLLTYFELDSVIGSKLQEKIQKFTELKLKQNLEIDEQKQLNELTLKLSQSVTSNFIHNREYFQFLKFIQENKGIDFNKYSKMDELEVDDLLADFKEYFND